MNIMFLDSIERETYGGMEEWIRLTASGLVSRGHEVTIAGREGSAYLARVSGGATRANILGLKISGDFNPLTINRLKKYIYENRIDIVTVNFNKDVRLGGMAALGRKETRVVWSVGMDITGQGPVHRYLTPRLIDGVIVPSESLKKQIAEAGYIDSDSITVIPIGIPEKNSGQSEPGAHGNLRRKYNLAADSLVAVTVARFTEHKGHRYLIAAAPQITAAYPQLVFLLVGDGPLRADLEAAIKAAGMEKHFILTGMREDIEPELAGADLMIHPSVREPFGIAVLEGMRAGLPVVASRIGGIPEVAVDGETGCLVEPRDPKALAEAVSGLLGSPEKRKSFGLAGKQRWDRHFRLETMLERIERYFLKMHGAVKQDG